MDREYWKNFGERVKARREEIGMTQLDLALQIGYQSKQAVSKIENGSRGMDVDRVALLADALDTTVDYLMGMEKQDLIRELEEELANLPEEYLRSLLVVIRSQSNPPQS